jgi:hypothetical protein
MTGWFKGFLNKSIMFLFSRFYKLEKLLPQIEKENKERRDAVSQQGGAL